MPKLWNLDRGAFYETSELITPKNSAATVQLRLPIGSASKPSLEIGNDSTGLYGVSSISLGVVVNGGVKFYWTENEMRGAGGNGSISLYNTISSSTQPAYCFRGDVDTGLGQAALDQLSLTAGGIEGLRVIEGTITSLVGTVVQIPNLTTAPTANASSGGFLYSDAGALKWRGSGGTITTLGAA